MARRCGVRTTNERGTVTLATARNTCCVRANAPVATLLDEPTPRCSSCSCALVVFKSRACCQRRTHAPPRGVCTTAPRCRSRRGSEVAHERARTPAAQHPAQHSSHVSLTSRAPSRLASAPCAPSASGAAAGVPRAHARGRCGGPGHARRCALFNCMRPNETTLTSAQAPYGRKPAKNGHKCASYS